MGILDQYKEMMKSYKEDDELPSGVASSETDIEKYKEELHKLRSGNFSQEEINEAIENTKKNNEDFKDKPDENKNVSFSNALKTPRAVRLTEDEMMKDGLLEECEISKVAVIRAYCPECKKELVAAGPPMINPFTFEKHCIHRCCGKTYNLDACYPRLAFYDKDMNEIKAYGI